MGDKMPTMGNTCLDAVSGAQTLVDPHPAEIDLLQSAWGVHWRIATVWGGPDFFMGHHQDHGAATWDGAKWVSQDSTLPSPIRVPPYVGWTDMAILISGRGKYVITTAQDTTGTACVCNVGDSATLQSSTTQYTAGPLPSSMGATSGRGIQLVANVRPYWQEIDLTVKLRQIDESSTDAVAGSNAKPAAIHGIAFRWIWQPQDITDSLAV